MFKNALKLALVLVLAFIFNANAQKIEYGISLNSGLFSFVGNGSAKSSKFNGASDGKSGYANNPYSNNFTLSYGFSANAKLIFNGGLFLSADLGYEYLRSKVDVVQGLYAIPFILPGESYPITYTGKSTLNQSFINFFPSVGYREQWKMVSLDFMFGTDLAYCLSAKEKYNVISSTNVSLVGTNDRKAIDFDIRPRVQIGLNYKEFGVYGGCSFGIKNYNEKIIDGSSDNSVNSNYIRFGLYYKLK